MYSTVIITGASAGLGEEFARQLATHCDRMVLVARRRDRIEKLKQFVHQLNSTLEVEIEALDLNNDADRESLVEKIQNGTYQADLLVNNAGIGDLGSFAKSEWGKVESMLKLNMLVLTHMAHAVIPGMQQRKRGAIINVSSMASIMPIPDFAAYAATKAYVTSFSEALRLEVQEENIAVTALCPGPVKTEFGEVATRSAERDEMNMKEWAYVAKETVVADALRAVFANKPRIFPGFLIKLLTFGLTSTPRPILRAILSTRPRKID